MIKNQESLLSSLNVRIPLPLYKSFLMLTKEKVRKQIDKLPEQFSLDDLVERLILIEKVEKAEKQSANNEVLGEDQLGEELEKWFK